jgi:sulfite exporter TauE/SafE
MAPAAVDDRPRDVRDNAAEWPAVLEAEYEALYGTKPFPDGGPADPEVRLRELHRLLHLRRPTAVCLSGGGIRSATFGLGVLQALARSGVLGKTDYLSTVSGGGYVGGWFTAWVHREGRSTVLRTLGEESSHDGPRTPQTAVDRLRATCRYLAPQGGIVSADLWTLLATMGRNLLLNWLVLLPLIAATLLVPRLFLAAVEAVERNVTTPPPCLPADQAPFWFGLLSISMFVVAIGYVVMNFVGRGHGWSQGRFLSFVVVPTLIGTVGLTLFWSAFPCEPDEAMALFVSAVLPAVGWLVIGAASRPSVRTALPALAGGLVAVFGIAAISYWPDAHGLRIPVLFGVPLLLVAAAALNDRLDGSRVTPEERAVRMTAGARTVVSALAAGPIVGFGAYWFAHEYFDFGQALGASYAVFAVPGVLGLILLANTIFLGLASSELSDAALEWWNRFAAWLAIVAALWLAAGVLVFYLADLIEIGVQAAAAALEMEHHTSSVLASVGIPLLSSLAGLVTRQGEVNRRPSRLQSALQGLALPLTIVALLATVAWFNAWALRGFIPPGDLDPSATLADVVKLGAFLFLVGMLVSRFVPVNRFSLHGMYRQRLVRTFLGASHEHRNPNAFTGFDPQDDLRVHQLAAVRPLHVINATLNNVEDTSYGRNERKAYPFAFTPLHVGSPILNYRRSCEYGSDGGGPGTGLSLGMALAVSGAAASPAMGIFSSKARAFLLTLANARLGLWFGNPSDRRTWRHSDPALGVGPVVRELLGLETDTNPYVYLSDGGHFENLGLWGMVQRRCAVIIVSDAGCDPDYAFDDLANAIRRIRLDLGIPIEFGPMGMSKAGQGHGNAHAVVGTVDYRAVDGESANNGTLLYIKATLSGDEPVDVCNFAAINPAFPHESTGNQFFSEDRFESYRALGYHSVATFARELRDADPLELCAAVRAAAPAAAVFAPAHDARV